MPSLKEFMEALAVAWPVALTALIGCTALLAGNAYGVRYATGIPEWILTIIFAVGIPCEVVELVNIRPVDAACTAIPIDAGHDDAAGRAN
ncbi:MAG: hypothetical protein EOS74_19485 [Mesorhizobium sp.]|nr:MAG: hypothetical protein EOS74_19485 [Mesorhizobium sp.]